LPNSNHFSGKASKGIEDPHALNALGIVKLERHLPLSFILSQNRDKKVNAKLTVFETRRLDGRAGIEAHAPRREWAGLRWKIAAYLLRCSKFSPSRLVPEQ
jgi:hypothetical protein